MKVIIIQSIIKKQSEPECRFETTLLTKLTKNLHTLVTVKPGSSRRIIGSPRQLETAVPDGVWV